MDGPKLRRLTKKTVSAVAGVFLFLLGLYSIKEGAGSFKPLLQKLSVEGVSGGLGAGWLMACLVLSGSPVAGAALALHASPVEPLDSYETFSMITGSRLGASFVVLLIGFIYDMRGKKHQKSVYVGAIALLTTLTTYLPAMFLGLGFLRLGWPGALMPASTAGWFSFIDAGFKPLVCFFAELVPGWAMVPLGVGLLLIAFKVFDLALPEVDPFHGTVARMATIVYRPSVTLLLGMLVTLFTLSVSVSVSILVPLTAKGYVRRENLIPYIMGANITTFIDTLVASILIAPNDGFTIVLVEMISVSLVSLPLVFLAYGTYERMIDWMANAVTGNRMRLALFVAFFLAAPVVLVFV